jgi:hypothetical protein
MLNELILGFISDLGNKIKNKLTTVKLKKFSLAHQIQIRANSNANIYISIRKYSNVRPILGHGVKNRAVSDRVDHSLVTRNFSIMKYALTTNGKTNQTVRVFRDRVMSMKKKKFLWMKKTMMAFLYHMDICPMTSSTTTKER